MWVCKKKINNRKQSEKNTYAQAINVSVKLAYNIYRVYNLYASFDNKPHMMVLKLKYG